MSIFDNDQKSMLDVYLYETNSLFEQLDTILMRTEKNHELTKDDIHSIFRIMHTTKSSSSMMNLDSISTLMHTVEDLFSLFRDNPQKLNSYENEIFELLFDVSDYMHSQLEHMKEEDYLPKNPSQYISRTQELLHKLNHSTVPVETPKEVITEEPVVRENAVYVRIYFEKESRMENIRAYMIMMQIKNLCQTLKYYPETLENNPAAAEYIKDNGFYIMFQTDNSQKVLETIHRSLFLNKCEIIDKNEYIIQTQPPKQEQTQNEETLINEPSSVIPVHVSKLDSLQNLVGELMIAESNMLTRMEELNQRELLELFEHHFHKALLDIEEIVMSSRLVPIAQIMPKLNRVVRDISHKEKKEIHFVVKGEDIEIDKEIVDSLFNPLMHLLRNAVDHGIESSEERKQYHKSEVGKIVLNVKNTNGEIVIHISDDGRGLDIEQIKEKAQSKGLLKPDRIYSREEIFSFIMLPGFSTNKVANEFSGRGVGLDVVKSMVEKFKGTISIESEQYKGTHITLHLPLTLTIIESLLFKVGDSIFSVPSHHVNQFFSYDSQYIQVENDHYVYLYKDKILPIIHLSDFLNITSCTHSDSQILIYVQSPTKEACLLVDDVIGYQHIVDKPLPLLLNSEFKRHTGISGCSLLGDGKICMTLNMELLLNMRGVDNE